MYHAVLILKVFKLLLGLLSPNPSRFAVLVLTSIIKFPFKRKGLTSLGTAYVCVVYELECDRCKDK